VKPRWQVMRKPGERCRQWLRLIVEGQCGQRAPGGVTAPEFHDSRREHQGGTTTTARAQCDRVRVSARWPVRQEFHRSQPDREKAGLEKKHVPLIAEEDAADVQQREGARPQQREGDNRRDARDERAGERGAAPTEALEEAIAGTEPAQGGERGNSRAPEDGLEIVQEDRGRQDPVATDQPCHLHADRDECREIDHAQGTQEQPVGRRVRHRCEGYRTHSGKTSLYFRKIEATMRVVQHDAQASTERRCWDSRRLLSRGRRLLTCRGVSFARRENPTTRIDEEETTATSPPTFGPAK
jgi:hypothetical protein